MTIPLKTGDGKPAKAIDKTLFINKNMKIVNFILAVIAFFFIFLIGIIPFSILYLFSDLVYFFLYYIFGYRKNIIYDNIRKSFPELQESEIKKLVRLSYKNLSDILVESFKGFTMTKGQIKRHHKVINPEVFDKYYDEGISIIALPNHYGNWEWGAMSPSLYSRHRIVALYKPLSNKYLDGFVRKNRSRTGAYLESIYKTAKIFQEFTTGEPSLFILASDQSPSNAKKAHWVKFLGRDTAFLHGPETYARKHNLPVFFVDIQRVKRGFYELELIPLTEKPDELAPGELTQMYAAKLEAVIRKKPENWLWSHRRWKLER
jgi:KDO2-lipid IV(A) lauroyltransferase